MPKYNYKCKKCEDTFETVHSMSEKLHDCIKCETSGSLLRIPSAFVTKQKKTNKKQKIGSVVEKSISDFREALKEQKKGLKETEYK